MRTMAEVRRLIPLERARLLESDGVLIKDIKNNLLCTYDQLKTIEREHGVTFKRDCQKSGFKLTKRFILDCKKRGYSIAKMGEMTGVSRDVIRNKMAELGLTNIKTSVVKPDRKYSEIEKIGLFQKWKK